MKRALSFILCLALLLSVFPLAASVSAETEYEEGNFRYSVTDGKATLIKKIVSGIPGELVIPDTLGGYPVVAIGQGAFSSCSGMTSLVIPESVIAIDAMAFWACNDLKTVTIKGAVETFGDRIFAYCSNLTTAVFEKPVVSIGDEMFMECNRLSSVTLSEGIVAIGERAFHRCALSSINIPNTVETIGAGAFHFNKFTSLTLPDSVTTIGKSAFSSCPRLKEVTFGKQIQRIGDSAFNGCSKLSVINLPDSVVSIGELAFYQTEYYENDENWQNKALYIGQCLISVKDTLSGVFKIKEGTTVIADNCFFRCTKMTEVIIPQSVIAIGVESFLLCTNLREVVLPKGLKTIGNQAFEDCRRLIRLSIQDGVVSIGANAFKDCSALVQITLPASVTEIGKDAFIFCSALTDVWYAGSKADRENMVGSDQNRLPYVTWHYDTAFSILQNIIITKQPKNTYAQEGNKAYVSVQATGDKLKYQWYIKNSGSTKYVKSSVKTAGYSVVMNNKTNNRLLYCVITDSHGNQVKSQTALIRRRASIVDQTDYASYATQGETVSAKVTALGDGLKYTWYYRNDSDTEYHKSSVKTPRYSTKMSKLSKNRRVYCVVTDKYGYSIQSRVFILRESVSIATQPKSTTVKKNTTAKVTVKAKGDGLKYTWYIKNEGAKKYSKSSVTKSTYSAKMTSKSKNRLVYCVVTDKYGNKVQSKTVRLKMK